MTIALTFFLQKIFSYNTLIPRLLTLFQYCSFFTLYVALQNVAFTVYSVTISSCENILLFLYALVFTLHVVPTLLNPDFVDFKLHVTNTLWNLILGAENRAKPHRWSKVPKQSNQLQQRRFDKNIFSIFSRIAGSHFSCP